jgi:3',5'-cyclic AMP phosphodiesterase CpdA
VSVVLQISDTHFGTEQPWVMEALTCLVREQRPSLLVLSGDITQRARTGQFRAARAFIDRLNTPWLALPGNHDIPLFNLWARWRSPWAGFTAAFGPELAPIHRSADLLVLGVNTTRAHRHRHGEVSQPQIEWVAQQLRQASPAQLRVVVGHQPLAVPRAGEARHLLRGHAAALRHWASSGADLVLGGHIHLPYVQEVRGQARPMWVVQAGTALSTRLRHGVPNSVNLLRWGEHAPASHCLVEQWDCDHRHPTFVRVAERLLKPHRDA